MILQIHFAMRQMFMILVSIIPSLPMDLGIHTASHLTKWYFFFGPFASQKNLARCLWRVLWMPSPNMHTPMACRGRLDMHTFTKMSLAAEDINLPVQGSAHLAA
jgi:hypothetical protein